MEGRTSAARGRPRFAARVATAAVVACLAAVLVPQAFAGGTYVVNTAVDAVHTTSLCLPTDDPITAPCSLRDAINLADADGTATPSSPATIDFDISPSGPQTISLYPSGGGTLPSITEPVTIDGSTQPGTGSNHIGITVDGDDGVARGLTLSAGSDGSTIRGLALVRLHFEVGTAGLLLYSSNNTVAGNYLGITAAGTAEENFDGIDVLGSNNTIGGPAAADGNVIAHSNGDGVAVQASNVIIRNNTIEDSSSYGVHVISGQGVLISKNSISDTVYDGISLAAGANNDESPPAISSAVVAGGQVAVSGTLYNNTATAQNVVLEVFQSGGGCPQYPQGETYVGSVTKLVGANSSTPVSFSGPYLSGDTALTATETDASSDTSPFSACQTMTGETDPHTIGAATLSNIRINGVLGTATTVAPGADVTISADWSDYNPSCPGCIDFVAVGYAGQPTQSGCIEDPGGNGVPSGSGSVDLGSAPSTPGTYDVVAAFEEQYACGDSWSVDTFTTLAEITVQSSGGGDTPQPGPIFTVNTPVDSDDAVCGTVTCSLRDAINAANAYGAANSGAPSTIEFALPTGSTKITLFTQLPSITEPVAIDGYSQPGASANTLDLGSGDDATPLVEIAGITCGDCSPAGAVDVASGGSGSTIAGLVFDGGFDVPDLTIEGDNVHVSGDFFGVMPDGKTAAGGVSHDIEVSGTGDVIGGASDSDRNLIEGAQSVGVYAYQATNLTVQGNFVGADATGANAVANGTGIEASNADHTLITGNVISGNLANNNGIGVSLFGASSTVLTFNRIGTTADGSTGLPNWTGVDIDGDSTGTAVGQTLAGNLVSGNDTQIANAGVDTTIAGNQIGTNLSGTAALQGGISQQEWGILDSGGGTTIGGPTQGDRNLIAPDTGDDVIESTGNNLMIEGNWIGVDASGNVGIPTGNAGIRLYSVSNGAAVTGNVIGSAGTGIYVSSVTGSLAIDGNSIGVGADGTSPVGNSQDGITVNDSTDIKIGDTTSGDGNLIANNGGAGVSVLGSSTGVSIRGNSIHDNGALGIDLGGEGVTANDAHAHDSGPNLWQNFPVVTSAALGNGSLTVGYSLSSAAANGAYEIDFYANATCDPSQHGQGSQFLGSASLATPGGSGNGNATLTDAVTQALQPGANITATATDTNGNTSEFSVCLVASSGATGGSISLAESHATAKDVDLTADGNEDWAVWGYANGGHSTSLTPDVRKTNGSSISDLTQIGSGAPRPFGQFHYPLVPFSLRLVERQRRRRRRPAPSTGLTAPCLGTGLLVHRARRYEPRGR